MGKRTYLDTANATSKIVLIETDAPYKFKCFRCNLPKKAVSRAQWTTSEGDKTICMSCYEAITKKKKRIQKKKRGDTKHTEEGPAQQQPHDATATSEENESTTSSSSEVYRHEHLTSLDSFQTKLKPFLLGKERADKATYRQLTDTFISIINGEREVLVKEEVQEGDDTDPLSLVKQEKTEEEPPKPPKIVIKPNLSEETSFHFYQTYENLLKIGGFAIPIISSKVIDAETVITLSDAIISKRDVFTDPQQSFFEKTKKRAKFEIEKQKESQNWIHSTTPSDLGKPKSVMLDSFTNFMTVTQTLKKILQSEEILSDLKSNSSAKSSFFGALQLISKGLKEYDSEIDLSHLSEIKELLDISCQKEGLFATAQKQKIIGVRDQLLMSIAKFL